jgi:hypothetical protein
LKPSIMSDGLPVSWLTATLCRSGWRVNIKSSTIFDFDGYVFRNPVWFGSKD